MSDLKLGESARWADLINSAISLAEIGDQVGATCEDRSLQAATHARRDFHHEDGGAVERYFVEIKR
jgi:hypothetical protein